MRIELITPGPPSQLFPLFSLPPPFFPSSFSFFSSSKTENKTLVMSADWGLAAAGRAGKQCFFNIIYVHFLYSSV